MPVNPSLKKLMSAGLAATMLLSVTPAFAANVTSDAAGKTYQSTTGGENAVLVSGKTVTLTGITVTKSGDSSGDDADFTGTNAAVLATNKATLTIKNATIKTNGSHANAVFSYGTGTTVNISDSSITTSGNNSGGIMTTGGGTTNASNLIVNTSGNSSAAIRSDRGGGDVNVTGGTYKTSGVGSPAIYSTADIDAEGATLATTASEAVVVEGGNSVSLTDCDVTGDNTTANGKGTTYQNVMIYQSMSGDATEGSASFAMDGGSMTAKNGAMFYVTNTTCTIDLSSVDFTNSASGVFLNAAAGAWGTSGSNGGNVTLNAAGQTFSGAITVDSVSTLALALSNGSVYTGAINTSGQIGSVAITVPAGCTWKLTGDSYVTSLTCGSSSIDLNGHKLYVNGTAYTAGTAVTGSKTATSTSKTDAATGATAKTNSTVPAKPQTTAQQTASGASKTQNSDSQTQASGTQSQTAAQQNQNAGKFSDVKDGSWYQEAVDYCREKGVISGTSATTFSPSKTLTRAEAVQLLYGIAGEPETTAASTYTDVSASAWYAKAVAWAEENGIISSTDTTFNPNDYITREDLVSMLYKLYQLLDGTALEDTASLASFSDAGEVSSSAREAVEWAVGNGIMNGSNGALNPDGTATRAQAAQLLYQFLKQTAAA